MLGVSQGPSDRRNLRQRKAVKVAQSCKWEEQDLNSEIVDPHGETFGPIQEEG